MFNKILIPLDGSDVAEHALSYARLLAEKLDCAVELLQAIDSSDVGQSAAGDRPENSSEGADRYLSEVAKNFPLNRAEYRVRHGVAAEVILETAAQDPNTLIVMASHGRSGIGRWLLGSVAEKVLRAASNPLLLVRLAEAASVIEPVPLSSILIALDGSKLAESVLSTAIELARRLQLEVVLVSAYQIPRTAYYRGRDDPGAAAFIPTREQLVDAFSHETRMYIETKVQELSTKMGRVRGEVVEGPAADCIIDMAGSMKGSLVAMSTHGRSGLRRWMLGSVTEKVARHVDVPVLIVGSR